MSTEFVVGTVAALTIAGLAFAAAWGHWRMERTAETVRLTWFLTGVGIGALCGPAMAAAPAALTGDDNLGELAAPVACVGIVIGGGAGHFAGKWAGRPRGRPGQDEEDYDEPGG